MKQSKLSYKEQRRLHEKNTLNLVGIVASCFFVAVTAVFPLFLIHIKNFPFNIKDSPAYSEMTFQKTFFFWIITSTSAFLIFFIFIVIKNSFSMRDYDVDNAPQRLLSVPEWALAAFIVFSFASAFVASFNSNLPKDIVWLGASGRYEGFYSFLCYALTFFIISWFYKYRSWHLRVLAGSSILVTLYGILQFMGIDIFGFFPFALNRPDFMDSAGNPLYGPLSAFFRTTLGNINIVSAYCTFAVVLFAVLFAVSKSKSKWNIIYISASATAFALCLITGDGGDAGRVAIAGAMFLLIPYWISDRERLGKIIVVCSIYSLVGACFSWYIYFLKKQFSLNPEHFRALDGHFLEQASPMDPFLLIVLAIFLFGIGFSLIFFIKKWPEQPLKIAGIIFLPAAIIGGILFVLFMGERWSDNPDNLIWQVHEILHGRLDDKFGSGRGWIWKNATAVLRDRPVLGSGPDTFYYALGDARQTEASRILGTVFDKAHNIFLQIAICMGFPAVLAYITFIGGLFASAAKKAFKRPLLLAFGAAALGYMINSFFCVEVPITTPLVWVAFGVIARELWLDKIGVGCSDVL